VISKNAHDRTLFYPELFGVADNNGYGLKVFAFSRVVWPRAHRVRMLHQRSNGRAKIRSVNSTPDTPRCSPHVSLAEAQTFTSELRNQRVLRPLVYFIRRGWIGRKL
jgi:hypothetical protein